MNASDPPGTSVESILHTPWPLPLWVTILIAAALFAGTLWLYLAERGGASRRLRVGMAGLRFALLALVLWMLAGWAWQRFRSDQPELLVVLDTSASMKTRDVTVKGSSSQLTRFEFARSLFESMDRRTMSNLVDRYQLKWFSVADKIQPLEVSLQDVSLQGGPGKLLDGVEADGAESRLGEAISRLVDRQAGRGTAAMLFVSDGISTSGIGLADAAQRARRAAIPVHSVVVGQQYVQPDLRLVDLLVDREVYFGDQVAAEVSVVASDIPAATTKVSLIDESTSQLLDTATIQLTAERNQQPVRLTFVPTRAGEIPLRVVVDAVDGETDKANNVLRASVFVQDKSIRVLMVFETPSYEFRFLKSLLERLQEVGNQQTSSFEVQSVLQDADPTYVEQDASALRLVPSQVEALHGFDVFVFGELNPSLISRTSQQAIVEAVTQKGAGSIFVFGASSPTRTLQNWPLGKLLPVEPSPGGGESALPLVGPWRWQPTALGMSALPMQLAANPRETLSIWERLPPVNVLSMAGSSKVGAQVLAEGVSVIDDTSAPLLVAQFAGAGRTALQATDESYVMTSFGGSDEYYQRYWGQMLRWLSRGKLNRGDEKSTLVVDPKQVKLGQTLRIQLALGSGPQRELEALDTAEVFVESADGSKQTYTLERMNQNLPIYQAEIDDLPPGKYRGVLLRPIEAVPPDVEFTVSAPPGEQANLRADQEAMRALAEQTRGRYYSWDSVEKVFANLPEGKPTRLGNLPPQPLWNSPWIAVLCVFLLTAEWLLRRKARML